MLSYKRTINWLKSNLLLPTPAGNCARAGFTLIELSIVLVVLAVMAAGALKVNSVRTDTAKIEQLNSKMDTIEESLLSFRKAYDRLPCPADASIAPQTANFGFEAANAGSCTGGTPAANFGPDSETVAGTVPTKTLGLPDSYMFDPWGRKIDYVVDRRITAANAFTTYPVDSSTIGDITIKDSNGNNRTGRAIVALISHGKNGHGAFTRNGARFDAGSVNTDEQDNCNCNNSATATAYNREYVQKRLSFNPSDQLDSFDDVVRYKLRWHFRSEGEETLTSSDTAISLSLAVSHNTSPYITTYGQTGDVFTKITDSGWTAVGNPQDISLSSDNGYLARASTGGNKFEVYKKQSDNTFTLLASGNFSALPSGGDGRAVAFSRTDGYVAVGGSFSDTLWIYKVDSSTDTFTRIPNSDISGGLPGGLPQDIAWSLNDEHLYVVSSSSPYLFAYARSNDKFDASDITISGGNPAGNSYGVAAAPGGEYVAVAHANSPYITLYKTDFSSSPNTLTKLANPSSLPTGTAHGAAFSPDGKMLVVAHDSSPYITIYQIDKGTDTFTKVMNPPDLPPGNAWSVDFSPDSKYMAVAHYTSPYITLYKADTATSSFTKLSNPKTLPTGDAEQLVFYNNPNEGPYITSVTPPANGTYTSGMDIIFTVIFSEPVTVNTTGGTPYLSLGVGTNGSATSKQASYNGTGSGSTELLFKYTPSSPDDDMSDGIELFSPVVRNGGTIKSTGGTTARLDFTPPDTSSIFVCTTGPVINSVTWPADGNYVTSDNIDFVVVFSSAVDVNVGGGTPRIVLDVGGSAKYASYLSGTGTTNITFRYTVAGGDNDNDGIDVTLQPTNLLIDLNGGTISGSSGCTANANLTYTTAIDLSGVTVNSSLPTITSVTPPSDGDYTTGQNLDFTVNWSENMTVTGTPRIEITLDSGTVYATYQSGSGTSAHVYRYTVGSGDSDSDGIVLVSPLQLNGGTIKNGGGTDGTLTFTVPNTSGITINKVFLGSTVSLVISSNSANYLTLYNQSGDTFTKATDPNVLPAGSVYDASWSYDDVYLATSCQVSPYVYIYKWDTTTSKFNKLSDPATLPADLSTGVDFSHSATTSTYLALGTRYTSPYLTVYKRSGDTFTKLADPATPPTSDVTSVRWSNNDDYLAIGGWVASPYLYIYKRSGDTLTKLADPASLPSGRVLDMVFSYDDVYFVVGEEAGNIIIYKRSGDTFTKLVGQPDVQVSSETRGIAFSHDSTYLAVAEKNSPYINIYKRSGDTFSKISGQPATLPSGESGGVDFSHDDNYLALSNKISPYVLIYKRSGDTFTKLADPATLPYADAYVARFSTLGIGVNPVITSISPPADANYTTGQNLDFTVNWSESMNVNTTGGTPRIEITLDSGTVYASYLSGSGTYAHTYRYTVGAGDSDSDGIVLVSPLQLNGGTIKNSSGIDGSLTFTPPNTSGITINNVVTPTITSVTPPANNTYIIGENLEFTVNWSENMTVNTAGGTPRIQLTIGVATRYASYVSGSGTSAHLYRYTVQAGDEDTNGIAMTSPLQLNGGTIKNGSGTDGDLTFTPPDTSGVLVDGIAPSITSITPPANATYGYDDNMDFIVNWDENVTVVNTPRLRLDIGGTTKYADYLSGSGTNALTFRYTVECSLTDSNGVDDVSPLELNGGTITDIPGNNANLTFTASNHSGVLVDSVASGDLELTIAHATSPYLSLYKNSCGVFSKLPDVTGGFPAGEGVDVVMNHDNNYIFLRHKVSPRITGYLWNGSSYDKMPAPSSKPSSDSTDQSIAIMHDDSYAGVSDGTIVIVYDSTFSSASTFSSWTPCLSTSIEVGHDGTYVAVGKDCSPYVDIYRFTDFSGPTFTRLTNPATLPTGIVYGMSFSSDSVYMATGHDTTPYITIYKRSGDTFTKLADPASLPAGNVNEVAFSQDDTYLAVGSDVNPNLIIYKRSGDTFTKLSGQPDVDPTSAVLDVGFSADGNYLAATTSASPYLYIYKRSGDTFAKLADPATLPAGSSNSLRFRNYKTTVSRPTDGNYTTGQNLDFYAYFPENVTVAGGTPRIQLTIGSTTRYANYASGSGTSKLLFRYTIVGGDSDSDGIVVASPIQLNGSTINFTSGGAAATLTFTAPITDNVTVN